MCLEWNDYTEKKPCNIFFIPIDPEQDKQINGWLIQAITPWGKGGCSIGL